MSLPSPLQVLQPLNARHRARKITGLRNAFIVVLLPNHVVIEVVWDGLGLPIMKVILANLSFSSKFTDRRLVIDLSCAIEKLGEKGRLPMPIRSRHL